MEEGIWQENAFHIHRKDGALFAFAGIYDTWMHPSLGEVYTYAILTTEPNELMSQVHNRMPIIFQSHDEERWLRTEARNTTGLLNSLRPLPQEQMEIYPVSQDVNS